MASTYLLKKDKKEEVLTLLKDMLKQIINTWMIMILKNSQYLCHTLTWIIYMVGNGSEWMSSLGGVWMVKKCWAWCDVNYLKKYDRIFSRSWP